jgi:hypothetical protein
VNDAGAGPNIVFMRPEYGALADEFGRLARAFGHDVDAPLRRDIARLAAAIERIDRCVDGAPDDNERRARWRLTVDGLRRPRDAAEPVDGNAGHFDVTTGHFDVTTGHFNVSAGFFDVSTGHFDLHPNSATDGQRRELATATADLRALSEERGVLERVRRIVAKEAATSEAIRAARTHRAFLRAIEREGRLTAALALAIAGRACGRAFRRFFFRLAAPANIVDKILDAKDDHARGEMALRPSLVLYGYLFGALIVRGIALVTSCPRPIFLTRLGLRYLFPKEASA